MGDALMQRYKPREAMANFVRARKLRGADGIMDTLNENEGYCRLALREWKRGWELYELGVGRTRHRRDNHYADATAWDGKKTKRLVLWGEQGLGDEIMFASCIPDVRGLADVVHIDTCKKLKGLFARSFPWTIVHGTRADDSRPWTVGEEFESRCIFGSLPKFFRNTDADFPGTPYLIADPQRRLMCRALLDSINRVNPRRAKVGIAWLGGTMQTGHLWRSLQAEQIASLVDQFPTVDWISLEYKAPGEGKHPKVHHFPYLVQTGDYDDTAALLMELDAVVTVQTAVVHLAGALGVPVHVLVSSRPVWRYGATGSDMLWYKSVKLHRQREDGDWSAPIAEVVEQLRSELKARHFSC
jgi:hypothetical protein